MKQISGIVHPAPPTWKMVKERDRKIQELQQQHNQKIRELRQQQLQQIQAMNRVKAQNRKAMQEIYQEKIQLLREQAQMRKRSQKRKRIIILLFAVLAITFLGGFGYLCNHTVGILDHNGTLRIYGIGDMKEISYPLQSVNREQVYTVIISNGITSIKPYAFQSCSNLSNVIIPNSVTYIGFYAFWGCGRLIVVSLPANAEIDVGAFPAKTIVTHRPAPE